MRTTLNLPDFMVDLAKETALKEDTTMTSILLQGLELPVSAYSGGLLTDIAWESLEAAEPEEGWYR